MPASSLFSRILMILGALAVAGFSLWFIYSSLMPVSVPSTPVARRAIRFDAKADLSKDQRFMDLRALVNDFSITPGTTGRVNPFVPVPKAQTVTTTQLENDQATSTLPAATSTEPVELMP